MIKGGTKSEDGKLLGTKSLRFFLEKLKRKIDIFIGTKNIIRCLCVSRYI